MAGLPARPRVAVLGVGAVGSVVGGLLADGGHDITLIDQWPENVETIKRDGLRVSGTCGERLVHPPTLHIHEVQSMTEPFDVVLLAVKSYDTRWATELAAGYLAPEGVVMTLQNGINDPVVAEIAGPDRAMGCVTLIGVAMQGPGHGMRTDNDEIGFKLGEHDGSDSERARDLGTLMGTIAGTVVTPNLWGERWSKLALNCMVNPLAALTGFGAAEVRLDERCERLGVKLGAEVIKVGRAAGHEVEPVFKMPPEVVVAAAEGDGMELAMAAIAEGAEARGNGWPSMLQDVRRRRRTEVAQLNGYVADEGRRLGVPTPLNEAVVEKFAEVGVDFEPRSERVDPLLQVTGVDVAA
jgi:2-dehydropantoate 2-reductase